MKLANQSNYGWNSLNFLGLKFKVLFPTLIVLKMINFDVKNVAEDVSTYSFYIS